jgi:predicted PurR-regulated permease PerM
VAANLVCLAVTLVFVLPVTVVSVQVVRDALTLAKGFETQDIILLYENFLSRLPLSPEFLQENTAAALTSLGAYFTGVLSQFLARLPQALLETALFVVALFYGLLDGPRLVRFLHHCSPFSTEESNAFAVATEKTCRAVVLGSLASGLAQGLLIGTAYASLKIPGALVFGTLTAVLSFIPAMGSGPTGIGGVIYLWAIRAQPGAALAMAIVAIIAGLIDNVIKPWVLSSGEAEIHPLIGLLAALGGLIVWGFPGLFLGPLLAALSIVSLKALRPNSP